jgi:hypothetical protein
MYMYISARIYVNAMISAILKHVTINLNLLTEVWIMWTFLSCLYGNIIKVSFHFAVELFMIDIFQTFMINKCNFTKPALS